MRVGCPPIRTVRSAAETAAAAVRKRVKGVESVGEALFKEWKSVLAKYSSADLEHNLNARAVAGLRGEGAKVDAQVDQRVTELNRAIAEANCFISDTDTSAD